MPGIGVQLPGISVQLARNGRSAWIGMGVQDQLESVFTIDWNDLAWSHNPEEVRIETCTLDHPAALALYQTFGFDVFDQRRGRVTLLEPNAGR